MGEYIAGMLEEDHSDDDTRELVREILKEAMPNARAGAVTCDRLFGLIDKIKKQQQQGNVTITTSPITSQPTKSTPKTNTTHTQQKDQQAPVISNNTTNKKKKKKKQATLPRTRSQQKTRSPPKTKTTHEIKQPSVNVEEIQRYMLHLRNNPDLDEFPMNNITIRTQIAKCEVAYYKIRHTNPVLAEVDMEFYHSLPPVQVLLGEMTRLESKAMRLEANDINNAGPTISTTTSTTVNQPTPKNRNETNSRLETSNDNTTTTAANPTTTTTTSTTV